MKARWIAVDGQRQAPAAFPRGQTGYPLCRRPCGTQGRSGWVLNLPFPPGFKPLTFQGVQSRYTDCALRIQQYDECSFTLQIWKKKNTICDICKLLVG